MFLYDYNRFPLAHVSQPHTVSAFDPPLINDCIIILFIVVANPPNRFIIISVFPPPFHFELRVFVSLVFWFSFGRRRIFLIFSRKCWFVCVCVCVQLPRARECDVRMSVCKCFSSCVYVAASLEFELKLNYCGQLISFFPLL